MPPRRPRYQKQCLYPGKNYAEDFPSLLRVDNTAEHNEHAAKNKAEDALADY
jgi:hypothetical protein